jgi:hypothetical protein
MRTLLIIGLISALSLTLAACGLRMSVRSGDVLFQDDFSRSISGWDQHHDATYDADYRQGMYAIQVHGTDTDVWSTVGLHFDDVKVQVEASKIDGPDNNIYGVLCRYQDARNFYFFVISSDGYAGIGVNKDGRRRLLSGEALLPSAAVRQGQAGNVIRADCIGFNLRLYVNGVLVAEAQAAEWPTGDVGLIAGTYDRSGLEVWYDNFSVVEP